MIALATTTFDPLGFVEINELSSTTLGETARRVNRIATLDGGVVINDGGFAEGDRVIELTWQTSTQAFEARIEWLVRTYSRLTISVSLGVFLVVPQSYKQSDGEATMRLLVVSKLSE